MRQESISPQHGQTENRKSDDQKLQNVEDLVDDVGQVTEELWHAALHFSNSETKANNRVPFFETRVKTTSSSWCSKFLAFTWTTSRHTNHVEAEQFNCSAIAIYFI
jgi:hypothetical protein